MRKPLSLLFAFAAALAASTAFAADKDSVTIGMALEPPTLDPTTGAAAAIGEITHYNIFEGLVKLDDNFNVTPLLAEKWTFSPDLKTLTFTLRQGVKFQDGEPFSSKDVKFSFERAAAKDSTNKEKAFFASIQSIDASDPATITLTFKEPSFQALYHLGLNTAVIVDEKSAATDATAPVGTGPYKFVSWNKGASATLEKWDGYRDAGRSRSSASPSSSSATRRPRWRRCWPATSTPSRASPDCRTSPQFQSDPRFQVLTGRHRRQDDPRHQQQEEAVRRSARPSGARLRGRPQSGDRRRAERPGDADRQPPRPQRPRLRRPDRRLSARPREGQGALEGGGRDDAAAGDADAAAARLRAQERRDHRRRARRGRHPGEDRGGRMGAVAVERLQGPQLRSDDHQPRRAARHRHLRQSRLLLPVRQPGVPRHFRPHPGGAGPRRFQGGDWRRAAADRQGLRQRLPLPAPRRDDRRRAVCRACGRTRRSSPTTSARCRGSNKGFGRARSGRGGAGRWG